MRPNAAWFSDDKEEWGRLVLKPLQEISFLDSPTCYGHDLDPAFFSYAVLSSTRPADLFQTSFMPFGRVASDTFPFL